MNAIWRGLYQLIISEVRNR